MYKWDENINIILIVNPNAIYEYDFLPIKIKANTKVISFEAALIWTEWILRLIEELETYNHNDEIVSELDDNKLIFNNIYININNRVINHNLTMPLTQQTILDMRTIICTFCTNSSQLLQPLYIELHHNQVYTDWFAYNHFITLTT